MDSCICYYFYFYEKNITEQYNFHLENWWKTLLLERYIDLHIYLYVVSRSFHWSFSRLKFTWNPFWLALFPPLLIFTSLGVHSFETFGLLLGFCFFLHLYSSSFLWVLSTSNIFYFLEAFGLDFGFTWFFFDSFLHNFTKNAPISYTTVRQWWMTPRRKTARQMSSVTMMMFVDVHQ